MQGISIPKLAKLIGNSPEIILKHYAGVGIEYRKPYQTRHTFITQAILHGISIPKLAKLIGNSPEIILKHYTGVENKISIPEM